MDMQTFGLPPRNYIVNTELAYSDDVESLLELVFDACTECNGFDNAAIKSDFEDLYRFTNGKFLTEIVEIIYAVCTLCRDHEKAGFIEGIIRDSDYRKR